MFSPKAASGCEGALRKSCAKQASMRRPFPPLSSSPLRKIRRRPMSLMSCVGEVSVAVPYGQDPETGQWRSPLREEWGLEPHQRLTPELEQRLCSTAAATFSYQRAAEVCAVWGSPLADDSTIQRHVQKAGIRSREAEKKRERDAQIPALRDEIVRRAGAEHPKGTFSLIIMVDGWMTRERDVDWGLKPAEAPANRVAWRETKTAIILRVEDRARTAAGRPLVLEKGVVAHQGEWDGLAKKLSAEASSRRRRSSSWPTAAPGSGS
jgi:hypothetical protein